MTQHDSGYIVVPNLDMNGGDMSATFKIGSYGEALIIAKQLIGNDAQKCASIWKRSDIEWTVYLKNSKKTNCSHASTHHHKESFTVFYGNII